MGGGPSKGGGDNSRSRSSRVMPAELKDAQLHSRYEHSNNRKVEEELQESKREQMMVYKLLLLGAGESGKSTIFKQLIQLYGRGFHSSDDRKPFGLPIVQNILESMSKLLTESARLAQLDPQRFNHIRLSQASHDAAAAIFNLPRKQLHLTPEIAAHIKTLWSDPAIKSCYDERVLFQLNDTCSYFFDKIDAIGADGYIPSYEDCLKVRARTTGIAETRVELEGNAFVLLDVGGQRNERKKWLHCFEGVTAVIFVAAISEYDQRMYEDNETNRLQDALALFGEICNSKWFRETNMILFLNKHDLFQEKVKRVDPKCCFPEYTGGMDYDRAVGYIRKQFLNMNKDPESKRVYAHVTCATDIGNVQFTFRAVRDIVIKRTLKEFGLLV